MSIKSLSIVAAAAMSLFAGAAQAVDLVPVELAINGGFETGNKDGWSQEFGTFPGSTGSITVGSPGSNSNFAATISTGLPGFGLGVGFKNANLAIGNVMPFEQVTISFDVKGSYAVGGVAFAEFFSELASGGVSKSVLLGGAPLFAASECAGFNAVTFTRCTFTTTTGANVAGGVTLQLLSASGGAVGSSATTVFDNVSISVMRPVPEPGTYALMLAGLVGVGAIVRRRRAV